MNEIEKIAGAPVKCRKDSAGKVVELWIERSRWARKTPPDTGRGIESINGMSRLLNEEGGMCCLGFYSRACGVPISTMYNICSPSQINLLPHEMKWLEKQENQDRISHDGSELIRYNDRSCKDQMMSEQQQECHIRKLFKKNGVTVQIV